MSQVITIEETMLQSMLEDAVRKASLASAGFTLRKWFTKSEVAEMFRHSDSWVDKKIDEGVFEVSKRKGSVTMISKRSIENYK